MCSFKLSPSKNTIISPGHGFHLMYLLHTQENRVLITQPKPLGETAPHLLVVWGTKEKIRRKGRPSPPAPCQCQAHTHTNTHAQRCPASKLLSVPDAVVSGTSTVLGGEGVCTAETGGIVGMEEMSIQFPMAET